MKTFRNLLAAIAVGAFLLAPIVAQANCDEKASASCCSKKGKKASMTMKKECSDAAKASSTSTTTSSAPITKSEASGQKTNPK